MPAGHAELLTAVAGVLTPTDRGATELRTREAPAHRDDLWVGDDAAWLDEDLDPVDFGRGLVIALVSGALFWVAIGYAVYLLVV